MCYEVINAAVRVRNPIQLVLDDHNKEKLLNVLLFPLFSTSDPISKKWTLNGLVGDLGNGLPGCFMNRKL